MTKLRKHQTRMWSSVFSALWVGVIVFWLVSAVSAAPEPATVEGVTFNRAVRAGDSMLALRGYGLLRYLVVEQHASWDRRKSRICRGAVRHLDRRQSSRH
jgi:hypothetical protein